VHRGVTVGATALLVLLTASCGSSARKALPQPTTTTTPRSSVSARDALVFREVLGSVPYDVASTSFPTPPTLSGVSAADTTCEGGKRVTRPQRVRSTTDVVLADRKKTTCYLLGPTLLTGHDIGSAVAVRDENAGGWVVNFHFNHDDFVPKVAGPYVGKQIAIIFLDVVESAPTINPGITGNDVTISGGFDEATARNLANALS
jgi:preprotein translocase subunit SecD